MRNSRKSFRIINPRLQFKIFGFSMIVFFLWFLTIIILYSTSVRAISEIQGQDSIVIHSLQDLSMYAIGLFILALIIIVFIGVQLTHKLVGPLYRIQTVLQNLDTGKIPKRFDVRKDDEEELRKMVKLLNNHFDKFRDLYKTSKAITLTLDKILSDNRVDKEEIEMLKPELQRFEQLLDSYEIEDDSETDKGENE